MPLPRIQLTRAYVEAILNMPGLVGFWPLWENGGMGTTYRDLSRNVLHMTSNGTISLVGLPGSIADNGFVGNGTSGRMERADDNALDLGDAFAMSAIIVPGATGANRGLVSKGSGGYYLRIQSDGKLNMLRSQIANIVATVSALTVGRTYHVIGTKSGGTSKLYVNGVDDTGTVTNSTCANNSEFFSIGCDSYGSGGSEFSNARIAMVGLHNRLLTAQEAYHLAALALGR